MDWLTFCVVMILLGGAYKAYQDNKLLKENPEAWKAQKQVEAAEKERKQKLMGNLAVGGFNLARFFWK